MSACGDAVTGSATPHGDGRRNRRARALGLLCVACVCLGARARLAAQPDAQQVASGGAQPSATAAPATGQVTLGSQSRIVIEPGDETIAVYYLLDVVNARGEPVTPARPFAFELPAGALNPSLLQGSSPLAAVSGAGLSVTGPFPPGSTPVNLGFELPADGAALDLTQRFPAALDQFAVIVKKAGDTRLSSPLLVKQQDMSADGRLYIAASGGFVAADAPLSLSVTGLPHQSAAPRRIALALAIGIALAGVWAAGRAPREAGAAAAEHQRLVARRERLLNELVRLEHDQRSGRVPAPRYGARREELIGALELVYGALDTDDGAPDPSAGAGVAA